nr:unnamed protein product [Spirometra erinaceieuropaei]
MKPDDQTLLVLKFCSAADDVGGGGGGGGGSLTSSVFAGFPNNCSNAAAAAAAAAAGQIQHSQFLLELLTGWRHRDAIHWVNEDSEYKLSNPERVASMWGQRKNKLAKNKNTLPPALRY